MSPPLSVGLQISDWKRVIPNNNGIDKMDCSFNRITACRNNVSSGRLLLISGTAPSLCVTFFAPIHNSIRKGTREEDGEIDVSCIPGMWTSIFANYDTTIAACMEGVDGGIKSHLQMQWYLLTNVHIHNSTISNPWSNFTSNRRFDALHDWHKTNECKGATRGASEYCLEFLVVQEKAMGAGWCRVRG
jgi:hypothetical protein